MESPTRSVLVATPEPLAARRAGPAVRAMRTAETLAADGHRVTLASTAAAPPTVTLDGVSVVGRADTPTDAEVVIVTGRAMLDLDWIAASDAVVGIDLYDPFQLEALHRGGDDRIRRIDLVEGAGRTLMAQLGRGDRFFCANEEQRSLWLGYLGATGRINDRTHGADPSLRSLIDLAPFGVDTTPPRPGPSPLRTIAGIGPDDPIAVWAGGLHDWLDPVTVIRAAAQVAETRPDFRLVFVAGPPPATQTAAPIARRARDEAAALGLTDRVVFFYDDWVPFDERGALLLDATIGVCAHGDHVEARFSHRTRFLDHLWAGLPTVTTGADPLSGRLAAVGAATVVEPGDHMALAAALAALLDDPDRRRAMADAAHGLGATLGWPDVLAPVSSWVAAATAAPDRLDPVISRRLGAGAHRRRGPIDRLRMQWALEGPSGVARRVRRRSSRRS